MTTTTAAAMTIVGLWRYPVKSMAAEPLPRAHLDPGGIRGDRAWALRDQTRDVIADARALPVLLNLTARFPVPPGPGELSPPVRINAPGAAPVSSTDSDVHRGLSEMIGRPVTLWPRLPAEQTAHYRRRPPADGDWDRYLREFFDVETAADAPDLSALPPEVAKYTTIPGTYFDAYPLHLITDRTLRTLGVLAGHDTPADVRRFRPNLLVNVPGDAPDPFPEHQWIGRRLRIGTVLLEVTAATPRCVMISHPVADSPRDRHLLRTVHTKAAHNAGVYARIVRPGTVQRGDTLTVHDAPPGPT
ncbi:MOSC domain-containing protein [Actinomadura sp. 21ATH]|uniref:MOSC domain-containing protein n=1 Tax=Actinomadura sp. 21ATH TaxID=1735444 RepID=UPI0035C147B8